MSFHTNGVLLACLGLTTVGLGQDPDSLRPIQGEAERGKVQTIDTAGTVTAEIGGAKVTRELSGLRSITLTIPPGAPMPRLGYIALRSGVQWPATVRETESRKVTIDSPLLEGRATIGLSQVTAIRFARLPVEEDGGFAKYAAKPKAEKDLIYFKTTEKIVQRSVTIHGFEKGSLIYEARDKMRKRELKDLYGIVMAQSSGFAPNALDRPRVVLGMQGGATVKGRLKQLTETLAEIETAEKVTLQVKRQRIRMITVESERLVFLTELDPKVSQVAAFRTKKPWHKNRSPLGEAIQLGGANPRTLKNGLVMIPKTSLTYDIGGKFDFFVATIGIDRRSAGPAHAIFRVRDGEKVLFESKPVTRDSEPAQIKVPIEAIQKLTIEADFGKNYDFGDHCVFAEARVIKKGT